MSKFWKNKKVLVTGAAGFVGSHVVTMLAEEGALVTAHVSARPGKKILPYLIDSQKRIRVVEGNLEDYMSAISATKNQDIVFNFAGMDGGGAFKREHSAQIFKSNSQIVLSMLEAAKQNGVKKFLLVSSVEVYPESTPQPIHEKYGFMKGLNEKIDGYAWSKRFSEISAKLYSAQYGMEIAIVRPGNIYGPRDHIDKGRVIPTFIVQALNNRPITVWDGGRQKKSFIHVRDLARGVLLLVEKYSVPDPVNLASDTYISIGELARKIIKLSGSKSKIKNVVGTLSNKERVISTKKAKKVINFCEHISLDQGLMETIDFFKKEKGL